MNECEHEFRFSTVLTESDSANPIYHQVGYSVCYKCGEVRKNNL